MRILPVVKAYPVADHVSFSEAVCVAGITVDEPHRWVRLFPLDFRGLDRVQRFRKYEVIELETRASSKDSRPESRAPILDSITLGEHIDTDAGTWRRRLPYFDAIEDESMCAIQRRQDLNASRLAFFVQPTSQTSWSPRRRLSSRRASEQYSNRAHFWEIGPAIESGRPSSLCP